MKTRFAVVLGTGLLLGGCFDAHYDVALNNDGSGTLVIDVVLDKALSRDILKEGKGKLGQEMPVKSLGKNAVESQRVENGSIVIRQSLAFKTLSDITAPGVDIEVQDLGRNLVGVDRSRIRFGTGHDPAVPKNDKNSAFASALAAQMFKGHEMRVTMHLPCVVENAESMKSDDAVYAPKVETSWFHGSKVEWRLPMSAMMELSRQQQDFAVTCWSFKGIPAGRSGTGKK